MTTSERESNEREIHTLPDLLPAATASRSAWKKAYLVIVGLVLIVVGIIGWVLPFMPGIPILILGLATIGACHNRLGSTINAAERHLPVKARLLLRPKRFRSRSSTTEQAIVESLFDESRGRNADSTLMLQKNGLDQAA